MVKEVFETEVCCRCHCYMSLNFVICLREQQNPHNQSLSFLAKTMGSAQEIVLVIFLASLLVVS
jgi:hypothetical protein